MCEFKMIRKVHIRCEAQLAQFIPSQKLSFLRDDIALQSAELFDNGITNDKVCLKLKNSFVTFFTA